MGCQPANNPFLSHKKGYGVYTGLVGSSWKPFSPLNPPILGDFEDSVSPKLGGEGGETQQFEEDPEICIHGSIGRGSRGAAP
jgi:hypothetical protein